MKDMKHLYDLKEQMMRELEKISRKSELNAGDLDAVHKLTDTIKNIDKICMLEEENGSSYASEWDVYAMGNSFAGRPRRMRRDDYGEGFSYAGGNGGGNNGGNGGGNGGGSMRNYSRGDPREEMMSEMERMMRNAPDEKTREYMRRYMEGMH